MKDQRLHDFYEAKGHVDEHCSRFLKGQCELGYQACALTVYHEDCFHRNTEQVFTSVDKLPVL